MWGIQLREKAKALEDKVQIYVKAESLTQFIDINGLVYRTVPQHDGLITPAMVVEGRVPTENAAEMITGSGLEGALELPMPKILSPDDAEFYVSVHCKKRPKYGPKDWDYEDAHFECHFNETQELSREIAEAVADHGVELITLSDLRAKGIQLAVIRYSHIEKCDYS